MSTPPSDEGSEYRAGEDSPQYDQDEPGRRRRGQGRYGRSPEPHSERPYNAGASGSGAGQPAGGSNNSRGKRGSNGKQQPHPQPPMPTLPGPAQWFPTLDTDDRENIWQGLRNKIHTGPGYSDQPPPVITGPTGYAMGPNGTPVPIQLMAPANTDAMSISHQGETPPGGEGSPGKRAPRAGRPEPGTEEWARMRKDNHKEVERRRRGNINEGINELARLVPGTGNDKAKGAILTRAVQYVMMLKEGEARNIEKWTLEKMLMDQALKEAQVKQEEAEKRYEAEKKRRMELEMEINALRGLHNDGPPPMDDGRPHKRQRFD